MPVYTIETPSGHRLTIEAQDEASAMQGAQQWHAQNSAPPDEPVSASGLAKAAGTGLVRGTEGLVGLPGDVKSLMTSAAEKLNPGANEARAALDNTFFGRLGKATQPPTSQQVIDAETKVTGGLHEPQNRAERFAQSGTEFVPAALAGPGSMARKAVMQGVVPGLASEAAGQAGEDVGSPTLATAGRVGAAVLAPGLAAKAMASKAPILSAEELLKSGGDMRDQLRQASVVLKPDVITNWAQKAKQDLTTQFHPAQAGTTNAILDTIIKDTAGNPVAMPDLLAYRTMLGHTARNFAAGEDRAAATQVLKSLDQTKSSWTQAHAVQGDMPLAVKMWNDADANYATGMRLKTLEKALDSADIRTAVKNSGKNFDNTARSKFGNIALNDKQMRGFNTAEEDQIRKIAKGNALVNTMRSFGNKLGGGGGIGQSAIAAAGFGAGEALDGHEGGALGAFGLPALGIMMRGGANRYTRSQINKLLAMTSARAPMVQRMTPKIVSTPDSLVQKGIRAILASSP